MRLTIERRIDDIDYVIYIEDAEIEKMETYDLDGNQIDSTLSESMKEIIIQSSISYCKDMLVLM